VHARRHDDRPLVIRAALLLAFGYSLACTSRSEAPARLTRAELAEAHAQAVGARAAIEQNRKAARRLGILIEPPGSQRNDDVQAFFNAKREPLWSCLFRDATDCDVVIAYDARTIVDIAVFDATLARRPRAEGCLAVYLADSPFVPPLAPGRILLVPPAIAPPHYLITTAPGAR
jgi:hypothetical protein